MHECYLWGLLCFRCHRPMETVNSCLTESLAAVHGDGQITNAPVWLCSILPRTSGLSSSDCPSPQVVFIEATLSIRWIYNHGYVCSDRGQETLRKASDNMLITINNTTTFDEKKTLSGYIGSNVFGNVRMKVINVQSSAPICR